MAFQFSKSEVSQIESLAARLQDKSVEVQTVLEAFNATLHEELSTLNSVVVEYNNILASVRTIVEEVRDQAQGEYDDKSERWQEGDRGEAVQEWLNELDSMDLEAVELYEVEPLTDFDPEHPSNLEDLQTEPNG